MAYPIFQPNTADKNTGNNLSNKNPVFGQTDNPKAEPLKTTKKWEDLNFGEKIWETAKEIPNTLYQFIPESIKQYGKEGGTTMEGLKAGIKGVGEFGTQIAQVSAQAVGGAVLGTKQLITKKEEKVSLPIFGEVSSYQVQKNNLTKQGFSDEEAKALVGINAYLGFMPLIAKGVKTKPGQVLEKAITTEKVPFTETPEGIREAIKLPQKALPEAISAEKGIFYGTKDISKVSRIEIPKITPQELDIKKLIQDGKLNDYGLGYKTEQEALSQAQKLASENVPNTQLFTIAKNYKDKSGFRVLIGDTRSIEVNKYKLTGKGIIPQELQLLAQEAKKYKSAEEFANVIKNKSFDIPLDKIKYSDQMIEYRGKTLPRRADLPIRVSYDMAKDEYFVIDGEHRVAQAIKNGKINIPAKIELKDKTYPVFTDFYNRAVKGVKVEVKAPIPIMPEKIVSVERPLFTEVKKIFGKTEEQQKFNQTMEEHLDKYFEGRQQILSPEEPLNKALIGLSDKELANYSKFTQGFEIPKTEITSKLKTAVELWKKVSKEEQDFLIKTKKLTPEQIENRQWKPVETITGRSRDELKAMGVEPQYYPYLAEDLLKKSDFLGTTGKRTKGGYLKRFTGKMLQENTYIKDPKIAIPRHRVQVFRDKMNDELVNNIRDNFAEKDPVIIKQLKVNPKLADQLGVEEWKPQGGLRFYPTEKGIGVTKRVESYWIPKTIASELNRFYRPGIMEKALRMTYDPLIDMWRVSVLGMVPRWLYNNVVGNTMLSILGKTDPMAFFKSAKEMFSRTRFGEKLGIKQREIPKGVFIKEYAGGEMAKAGQLGGLAKERTQFLRPIDNWLNLLEQAKNYKALRIPATVTQGLIKGWIALGKPIGFLNKVTENFFRGAMYISKTEGKFLGMQLDKPVPPVGGLKYVNEFLFDYSKLTRSERATFRRVLPFYNWMKNITEFSFKFPVNYPLRGLIVGALLQDYVDYINEINQKEDKTKSILRIKTDMTYNGTPLYLNVKSAIPFSDVFRTIPTNFETFGRFLTSNPVSKIIIERAFKINSFTGQPFTQPSEMQTYDEYGKPVLPLPSIPEHLGQQMPQIKLGQSILDTLRYKKPLKRYETGEPKIYRGKIQTEDWLFPILRYFGISISPIEINKIKESVDKKGLKQEVKENLYERRLRTGLEKLENQ